jgi:ankyrin repeat protein/HEAT repeat protein
MTTSRTSRTARPLWTAVVLLLLPGSLDAQDADLDASLFQQSGSGTAKEVAALLQQGASVSAVQLAGRTPLHVAAQRGHLEVMRLLIDAGADVNARAENGHSVLAAAAWSNTEAVQLLLDSGAAPSADALLAAAGLGRIETAKLLVEAGVPPQAGLSGAAQAGRLDLAKWLLDKGATALGDASDPYSPLHPAASQGGPAMVELLLDHDADPNRLDKNQQTPLHRAVMGDGDLRVVQSLVAAGAKLNIPNKDGVTPVRLAGIRGAKPIYDWLVEQNGGAEPYPAFPPAEQKQPFVFEETIRDLSSKQKAVRDAAMRRLALHQKVAMPQVLKLMEDGGLIERYVDVLPAMGPEAQAAIPLLAARLSDEKLVLGLLITINRIKPGASEELPEDQKQTAAATLYKIIVDPGSGMTGGFASQLLPSLGVSAVPTILRLLEHDNPRIRAGIPRDVYRSDLRDDRLNAAISKMARADKDASVRTKAAEALTVLGIKDERPRAELLAIIKRPPPHTGQQLTDQQQVENDHAAADRKAAASALAAFGPEIIDDLVPLLTPLDNHERYIAMTILQRLGPPAIPRLIKLLGHDDQAVAISASVALNRMRRPAVPALVEVLKSADDQAVIHSCSALWWIGGGAKAAKPALLQVASDKSRSDAVRLAAVRAVQKVDPDASKSPEVLSTLPLLMRMLESGDFVQQGQAAAALGEIGPAARDALPLLQKRLALPAEDVDAKGYVRDYVQREARTAIESITGSPPARPQQP